MEEDKERDSSSAKIAEKKEEEEKTEVEDEKKEEKENAKEPEIKESPLKSGELKIGPKNVACSLNVSKTEISWTVDKAKSSTKFLLKEVAAVVQKEASFTLIVLALPPKKVVTAKVKRSRKDYSFFCKDEAEAKEWTETLTPLVLPNGTRRLTIFVNPFSGKKKAPSIFKEIQGILEAAGLKLQIIETKKRFHAKEQVLQMDLSTTDGIITVSGDGLVWEVINGLMERKDWDQAIKIPIGVVAAGTGNALASAFGYFADPLGAALVLIKGNTLSMDLWRVVQGDRQFWAFIQMAWGIVADVDIESEKFRWMGDARYTMGGVKGILALRRYHGKFHYLPSDDPVAIERSRSMSSMDLKGLKLSEEEAEEASDKEENTKPEDGKQESKEEEQKLQEGSPAFSGPVTLYLDSASDKIPEGWKTVEDEFVYFVASNITHMTVDMVCTPKAIPGDGNIDVVISRTGKYPISKSEMLSLFGKMENGDYVKHKAMEYLKVKAIVLEPGKQSNLKKGERNGTLTIDGEKVTYTKTLVENIPGLATFFSPL